MTRTWSRIPLLILSLLLALVALPAGTMIAPQAAVSAPGPDFDDIDAFVSSTMQDRGVPGVALAIIRGDQVVHRRGFGVADPSGRVVTHQTPFRIGSNSKGFTALAIKQLVEQGRIDLDAPVQRYLPWFRLADAEAASGITVTQLLNHTSGIPGSALYESFTDPNLTLEVYGHRLAAVHPNRPVGSSFEYSNANYNLLGLIAQGVSGQSYAGYVQEHIFAPLEMTHSAATAYEERQQGLAQGYAWWFGLGPFPADERLNQANLPAGYLSSTAEDLSHYLLAQMNGGRYGAVQILSAEGIARMHAPGPDTLNVSPSGKVAGYGMGWATGTFQGVPVVAHDGETWSFKSLQLMDIQNGWGMVLLLNATNQLPSQDEPYRTLENGILDRLEGRDGATAGPSLRVQYAVLDAVLLALSAGILSGLARLPAWNHGLEPLLQEPRGLARAVARTAFEVALPLVVLVLGPSLVGVISWALAMTVAADVAWWTLAASGLLLVTGLIRGILLARALRHRQHPTETAAADVLQPGRL